MPPDLQDWLPADHLTRSVIDSVAQIDLSSFYGRHRDDGWGRAAYDPRMMVTRLLYAYAIGVRSAREIERLRRGHRLPVHSPSTTESTTPPSAASALANRAALSELFVSVLGLWAIPMRPALDPPLRSVTCLGSDECGREAAL